MFASMTKKGRAGLSHKANVEAAAKHTANRRQKGTGAGVKIDALTDDLDRIRLEDKEQQKGRGDDDEIPESMDDDTSSEVPDDPLLAAALMHTYVPPVKQEDVDEEAEGKQADEDAEASMGDEEDEGDETHAPRRVFRPFPVPEGSDPIESFQSVGPLNVVNMYAGETLAGLPVQLKPSMYVFDFAEEELSSSDSESDSEGAKLDRAKRNAARTEHNAPIRAALAKANERFPTARYGDSTLVALSALYAPLKPAAGQEQIPDEDYIGKSPRFHASWVYPGQIVTSQSSMEGLVTETMRVEFPLLPSAQKKHFMQWQLDPTRSFHDPYAFSIPMTALPDAAVVLSARFTTDPVITLGPHIEYAATLASRDIQGFDGDRINPVDAKKDRTFYAMSEKHAALYNSPEFRRWAGISAQKEKATLRGEVKDAAPDASTPVKTLFTQSLKVEGKGLEEYIKVPLLTKPKTLAQLLVVSHANELHAASLNMRRSPPNEDRSLLLRLDLTLYAGAVEDAKTTGYFGHVLVHLDALDAVIDYYCDKYHPAQFAAREHLLKIIPKDNGMLAIKAMASAENKAGGIYEYARMFANVEVTYMPYLKQIHRRPDDIDALEQMTDLVEMADKEGTVQELASEMIEAGLGVIGLDKNPCFPIMAAKFAARKMMDRENEVMFMEYIPPSSSSSSSSRPTERRAQDAAGMLMVSRVPDPQDGDADTTWEADADTEW